MACAGPLRASWPGHTDRWSWAKLCHVAGKTPDESAREDVGQSEWQYSEQAVLRIRRLNTPIRIRGGVEAGRFKKMAAPPGLQERRTTEYCCTAWYCQGPPGTPIRFAGGPWPFLRAPCRAPAQHTEHHHTWLSISRVAVPKDTGWPHARQETGDRCCAIRPRRRTI